MNTAGTARMNSTRMATSRGEPAGRSLVRLAWMIQAGRTEMRAATGLLAWGPKS